MELKENSAATTAAEMLAPWVAGEPQSHFSRATAARTVPFVAFMAFIAVEEFARLLLGAGSGTQQALGCLYPFKAGTVALLLWLYRKEYREFSLADITSNTRWLGVSVVGVATFVLWVCMDWTLSVTGAPAGFDPALFPAGPLRVTMTGFRILGAVMVVPLMEELFWRSFLLRYLIDADFQSIPLGRFSWGSFLIGSVLFGLEHHFFIAGVAAGIIYSILLYRTRSIAQCVLAHAVTNLALACYVLSTGKWYFW